MSDDVIFCSVHGASSPANIGCIACDRERQRELESLRAKLAKADKRIEDLEMVLFRWEQGGRDDGIFWITDKQIDAVWWQIKYLEREPTPEQRRAAYFMRRSLEIIDIVACPDCGGLGHWEQEPQTGGCYPDQTPECPSCHGHGWVRKE